MKTLAIFMVGATLSLCAEAKQPDQNTVCLAQNIYHEARGEPLKGQIAVAVTTLNRVNSGKFPNTICKVVYQPGQFTWTSYKPRITDQQAWRQSLFVAQLVQDYAYEYVTDFPALYFHSHGRRVTWRHRQFIATIGKHSFYY